MGSREETGYGRNWMMSTPTARPDGYSCSSAHWGLLEMARDRSQARSSPGNLPGSPLGVPSPWKPRTPATPCLGSGPIAPPLKPLNPTGITPGDPAVATPSARGSRHPNSAASPPLCPLAPLCHHLPSNSAPLWGKTRGASPLPRNGLPR